MKSWLLIAKTGFTTADLLAHLAQQRSQHFDVAVVSLGVNDVTRRVATRHWLKQQQELVELLATKFGVQKVLVLSGVPPMGHFKALPQPLRWYVGLYAKQFNRQPKKSILITMRMVMWSLPKHVLSLSFWQRMDFILVQLPISVGQKWLRKKFYR
ncbi:MAG: SGNH/GDSL hydrolase family protein [Agitococcus sp.]